jgi:hypothetical protein
VFKVTFSTTMELERMQIFGTFLVPNSSIQMKVDHSIPAIKPVTSLPEVWVYVTGIPPKRKGISWPCGVWVLYLARL